MTIRMAPPRPKKMRQIHDFMSAFYEQNGHFPTRRQIAAGLNREPNGYISRVVDKLRTSGHLRAIERARR